MPVYVQDAFAGSNGTNLISHASSPYGGAWGNPDSSRTGLMELDGTGNLKLASGASVESWATNAMTAVAAHFDQSVSASVLLAAVAGNSIFGVACRVDTTKTAIDGVLFRFAGTSNGSGSWQIFEATNGTLVQIGSNSGGITMTGQTAPLVGTCVGSTATLYANGVSVCSGTIAGVHMGTGSQLGMGIYSWTGTGTAGLKLVGPIQFNNYANGSSPASVSVETRSEGNETCWTPTGIATSYHVQKSTNGGSTYNDIAIVATASEPCYLDLGVTSEYLYRVVGYLGASADDPSSAVLAFGTIDTPLAISTVTQAGPQRHNLMQDSAGNFIAIDQNDYAQLIKLDPQSGSALFTQQTILSGIEPSPISDSNMFLLEENLLGGSFSQAVIVGSPSGGITENFTGNKLNVAGATNCGFNTYHGPAAFQFACTAFAAALGEGATGRFGIGLGADRSNGVFLEFYSNTGTPQCTIFGVTSGTRTTLMAAQAVSTALQFEIAMEAFHASFNFYTSTSSNSWSRTNGGSVDVLATQAYDLRLANLSAWLPCFYYGSGSGDDALAMSISAIIACYFHGGEGKIRESAFVTWPDGTPYEENGLFFLSLDKCINPNTSSTAQVYIAYACHQVYRYDPRARRTVGKPIALIGALQGVGSTYTGGMAAATQDNKIIFNPTSNGFDIYFNTWSVVNYNGSDAAFKLPDLYHQFWPGPLSGAIYLDAPTKVALPSSFAAAPNTIYGIDAIYAQGAWRVLGTLTNSGTTIWQTILLSGSSLESLTTIDCFDGSSFGTPSIQAEGACLFRLGDRCFASAGSINTSAAWPNGGTIAVWQLAEDFSSMNGIGLNTVSTTITSGAASATQTVASTSTMQVGVSIKFHTSNVIGVIAGITNSTTVVMANSLTTTTGETVSSVNLLSYPNPNALLTSGLSLPQQPAIAVFGDGSRSEIHLIGQDDNGAYANMGRMHVYVAGLFLNGWQNPRRVSRTAASSGTAIIHQRQPHRGR